MTVEEEPGASAPAQSKWEKWKQFLIFAVLTVVCWYALTGVDFDTWKGWIIIGAAFFFPVLALLSFFTAYFDWSDEKSESVTTKTFAWIIGAPIAVVAALYLWEKVSGSLSGTPWWAFAIIALLVVIVMQLNERR